MNDQQEAAILTQGQQEADRQMLETLLMLDPVAREQFMYIKDHVYADMPLADFVQTWREIYDVPDTWNPHCMNYQDGDAEGW